MSTTFSLLGQTFNNVAGFKQPDSDGNVQTFTVGGGGSSFTLIGTKSITKSTTSTSGSYTDYYFDDPSDLFADSIPPLYVRLRDNAGPRNGYYYGFDALCIPRTAINTAVGQVTYRYTDDGVLQYYNPTSATTPTSGYGIWCYNTPILSSSSLRIRVGFRYNATSSLTIDGTYTLEVYAIDIDTP